MSGVLIAAGGASWEATALRSIELEPDLELNRRCVDVADLVSAAQAGTAIVALVSLGLPGLDADIVHRLRHADVYPVALDGDAARCHALGIADRLEPGGLAGLSRLLPDQSAAVPEAPEPTGSGTLVAVWGPIGAPGRSTVALTLADYWARSGRRTVLVDADPFGGSIAQMLGVLDEVSGLLSAARAANDGRVAGLSEHLYSISEHLHLLTGLPRPELWSRIRAGAADRLLERLRQDAEISVLDAGFCLESPDQFDSAAPSRNQLTLQCLEAADGIVAVGRADPVGLTRLVRGLHDLEQAVPSASISVVVNMTRGSIGWSEKEMATTVERLSGVVPAAFLPFDPQAVDAATIDGRTLHEVQPDCRFVRAIDKFAEQYAAEHLTQSALAVVSG